MRKLLRSALPEHTLRSEPDHGFMTDHVYDTHMPHMRTWLEAADLVVVPLRHPAVVARSWSYSANDTSFYAHWHEQWENLMILYAAALCGHKRVITVPVDLQADKYRPLRDIEKALGAKFPEELLQNIENPSKRLYNNPDPDWMPLMAHPPIKQHYEVSS